MGTSIPIQFQDHTHLVSWLNTNKPLDFIRRENLDYMRKILACLQSPQNNMGKVVHVGGTNGKGSTCLKVWSGIKSQGHRVALFSSPHILRWSERIKVGDVEIKDDEMVLLANHVIKALHSNKEQLGPIGLITCIAFLHFQKQAVDYSVIEVDLGGKMAFTNTIDKPVVTAITSIGLDHQKILGETREEIAKDKVHIFRTNAPAVLGPRINEYRHVKKVIEKYATALGVPFTYARKPSTTNYEKDNRETALQILKFIFPGTKYVDFEEALRLSPPARYQKIFLSGRHGAFTFRQEFGEFLLFDAGHNQPGLEELFTRFQADHPYQRIALIFGIAKSKKLIDCSQVLSQFKHVIDIVYVLDYGDPDLHPPEIVTSQLRKDHLAAEYIPGDLTEGLKKAGTYIHNRKLETIVSGSFKVIRDVSGAFGLDLTQIPNRPHVPPKTPSSKTSTPSLGPSSDEGSLNKPPPMDGVDMQGARRSLSFDDCTVSQTPKRGCSDTITNDPLGTPVSTGLSQDIDDMDVK